MSAQSAEPVGYWFCPLFGFDANRNSIELSKNIKIEKLEYLPSSIKSYLDKRKARSKDDFVHFLTLETTVAQWFMWLPQNDILRPTLSTIPEAFQDEGEEMFNKVEEVFIDVVTALRLCHSGIVTPGEIVSLSILPNETEVSSITERLIQSYIYSRDNIWFSTSSYILVDSDIPKINGLIEAIGKWKTQTAINIAVRRFNLSYSSDFEGKIIDQMIAFESLFLGYDQELKYRLALRTAFLLGKYDKEERNNVFNNMRKAYNLRSEIVHGNKEVDNAKLQEIIPQTEEYLRQSIRKFLSMLLQGHTLKSLRQDTDEKLAQLDENVLNNGDLLD